MRGDHQYGQCDHEFQDSLLPCLLAQAFREVADTASPVRVYAVEAVT